jgi:hypothetical protein
MALDGVGVASVRQPFHKTKPSMNVFVVVTYYMDGIQGEQVFASAKAAELYLANRAEKSGRPQVEERAVIGRLENPNFVFTAATYDRAYDTHNFKGVYGNYDDAKKAAGEKGLVLSRSLE